MIRIFIDKGLGVMVFNFTFNHI